MINHINYYQEFINMAARGLTDIQTTPERHVAQRESVDVTVKLQPTSVLKQ